MTDRNGPGALADIHPVSRETGARLEAYVALLRRWQAGHNLVGPATMAALWRRHVADSAQLLRLAPDANRWLDLGSGAGFPGLVVAILIAGRPDAHVDLVESDRTKAAFLRAAIRETGAPAEVHAVRIESVAERWPNPVDRVTARALAPLDRLFPMVAPLIARGAVGLFHKGQDVEEEMKAAAKSWHFSAEKHASLVQDKSWIVAVTALQRKAG